MLLVAAVLAGRAAAQDPEAAGEGALLPHLIQPLAAETAEAWHASLESEGWKVVAEKAPDPGWQRRRPRIATSASARSTESSGRPGLPSPLSGLMRSQRSGFAATPRKVIWTGRILPSASNSRRSMQLTRWSRPRFGIGRRW